MQLSRADLADFAYFLAIAKRGSFKQAALAMGVTTSALGHAITALEARRGVEAIGQATETLDRYRDEPAGRVTINVLEDAVTLLLDPVMPIFVDRYPAVEIAAQLVKSDQIDAPRVTPFAAARSAGPLSIRNRTPSRQLCASRKCLQRTTPRHLACGALPKKVGRLPQASSTAVGLGSVGTTGLV